MPLDDPLPSQARKPAVAVHDERDVAWDRAKREKPEEEPGEAIK